MLLLPLPGGAPGGPRGSTRWTAWPGVAVPAVLVLVPAVDVASKEEEREEPTPEGPPAPRPRPRGGGRGDMPLRWAMAAGHLRRAVYTKQTRVSDHAVYTRGRLRCPCATADTHQAFIGSDVYGACWRRLGAAQVGRPWKTTRQSTTHSTGKGSHPKEHARPSAHPPKWTPDIHSGPCGGSPRGGGVFLAGG